MAHFSPPEPKVRSWKRVPKLSIPVIPGFSATTSTPAAGSSASAPATPITPATPISAASSTSTQSRLRAARRTKWEKVDDVFSKYGFDSLGEFLQVVFYHHKRGDPDPRTPKHTAVVTSFLQGSSKVKMADIRDFAEATVSILELIYGHPQSRPKQKHTDQLAAYYSPTTRECLILFARPCLNAWATRTVGDEIYRRVGILAQKTDDPSDHTHIRASTNGRKVVKEGTRVVTWDDTRFTMEGLAETYRREVVVRTRRPHPSIQVAAISSFILSRNSYASGDLALPLGIWHFAAGSHVDVKRVYCRLGNTVSDTTARSALVSMSQADSATMKGKVQVATTRGESAGSYTLDNVQYYDPVLEHGLGRVNELKVGTAATFIYHFNARPRAFDAQDHIDRIFQGERQNLTTDILYDDIDWPHIEDTSDLHLVRVIAEFTPHLNHLAPQISARFRDHLAKHPIPVHKTILQPLGTNAEREVTSQGMHAALKEFDRQIGIEPEKCENILLWVRGDGGSHATIMGLKKYFAHTPNIYNSLRNVISTPELRHTKATDLNSCASNHYGPATSNDPSSLSCSSQTANMKRPTDLKKCDFYPTSRSMNLIWEAQVLDCWRLVLGIDTDIHQHFEDLAAADALPTLDELLLHAAVLRQRYASQSAYNQSLSKAEYEANTHSQIPTGTAWIGSSTSAPAVTPSTPDETPAPATEQPFPSVDDTAQRMVIDATAEQTGAQFDKELAASVKSKKVAETHAEEENFDGDRVLSNSILFMMEFGWWVELNYAIAEGDIGRVLEILKVYIFTFAGTSNQNYMRYMLDLYTLLKYESSAALRDTLLDNYLLNLRGEPGHSVEGDLTQEWSNKWIIGSVKKRGAEFDDKYFREAIAPNVRHFLQIKEDVESAFDLKRRSKSHTSPHLRDETKLLLRLYKEEQLHLFRTGRSMGHAAINRFDRGYQRLADGKMAEYLERGANYASVVSATERARRSSTSNMGGDSTPPSTNSLTPTESQDSPLSPSPDTQRPHDGQLTSGSDLTVTIDTETEEREFEEVLAKAGIDEDDQTYEEEEDKPEAPNDVDSDEE
ncbi:hypothetical protein R3P38DRAFT_3324130 [Favolaschia claudopus]|uniref:DUF6589 domain-containing protein n=1 Tax=Favolaschia claudopus TaxID=2862362 RepID=A0AAW0AJN4_9AGAR